MVSINACAVSVLIIVAYARVRQSRFYPYTYCKHDNLREPCIDGVLGAFNDNL